MKENQSLFLGPLAIVFVSSLANAGGIGGGALLTPIYIWIYGFSFEDAIPLSKMTIFTGAIVNYIISSTARMENDANYPLINYKLSGLIIPMILAGTTVGVMFAKVLPPILILFFLIIFLMITIIRMIKKGILAWKKESQKLKLQEDISNGITQNKIFDDDEELANEKKSLMYGKNLEIQNNNQEGISVKDSGGENGNKSSDKTQHGKICIYNDSESGSKTKTYFQILYQFKLELLVSLFCFLLVVCYSLLKGGKGFSRYLVIDKYYWN